MFAALAAVRPCARSFSPAFRALRFLSDATTKPSYRSITTPKTVFDIQDSFPVFEQATLTMDQKWAQFDADARNALERNPPPTPFTGRTVNVQNGDVGQAYNRLRSILARNSILREANMAERHEKRGVKRRRLASQRWRRVFANEVRKKVQLVSEIRHRNRVR
jgi:small subunit ribosomal protein MRP21